MTRDFGRPASKIPCGSQQMENNRTKENLRKGRIKSESVSDPRSHRPTKRSPVCGSGQRPRPSQPSTAACDVKTPCNASPRLLGEKANMKNLCTLRLCPPLPLCTPDLRAWSKGGRKYQRCSQATRLPSKTALRARLCLGDGTVALTHIQRGACITTPL